MPGQNEQSPPSQPPVWLPGALLVLCILVAYQPVWHAGFIWDDDVWVTRNPLLTAPDGLRRIWFSLDSPSQYFPLVYTSFRFERFLWGLNPSGYHLVNLLLHCANALLAWKLFQRLGIPGAGLAAALFALHPVQVESVAWITERKNVLSLFFCLLALLAWMEFISERPVARWRYYALALVCQALALFSKTTACTLPAALILVLWLTKKPVNGRRWLQVAPFAAMGAAMGVVSIWWETHRVGTTGAAFAIPWLDRLLIASRALWFYAGKLAWPAHLTFFYPRWNINAADPLAYGWLVALAGLGLTIWLFRRRWGRGVETAAVYYVATLSPLLGFIMLYTFRYTFVADHYQYAASLGPCALAAAGLTRLLQPLEKQKPGCRDLILAGLLLTLGILTWRQVTTYQSAETLYRATLATNPDAALAHDNLGLLLFQQGKTEEATEHFRRAVELDPDSFHAQNNLANALRATEKNREAIAHYEISFALNPTDARTANNLAWMLATCSDATLRDGRRAVEIAGQANRLTGGGHPMVLGTLAAACAETGDFGQAQALVKKALQLLADHPDSPLAQTLRLQESCYAAGRPFHENSPADTGGEMVPAGPVKK